MASVCMHVCMYVCMYVYTFVGMVNKFVGMVNKSLKPARQSEDVCMYVCMNERYRSLMLYVCMHACMHVCMYERAIQATLVFMNVCIKVCMHAETSDAQLIPCQCQQKQTNRDHGHLHVKARRFFPLSQVQKHAQIGSMLRCVTYKQSPIIEIFEILQHVIASTMHGWIITRMTEFPQSLLPCARCAFLFLMEMSPS